MSTTTRITYPPSPGHTAPAPPDPSVAVAGARRGVLAYLLLVVILSGLVEAVIILTGQKLLILALMWTPALASILVRLIRREGFNDVSFRFGGRRTRIGLLLALLLPLGVGLVVYGLAWSLGLATFAPPETLPVVGEVAGPASVARFVLLLGIVLTTAAGEEIGWRGYLVLRLLDGRVPHAIPVSGLIWGLWHVPLIVAGLYAAGPSPLLSAAIFMVVVVAMTVPISWMRLVTGSIWPAVLLHGAWNGIIRRVFDGVTTGSNATLWTGDSGLLTAAVLVVVAIIIARRPWPVLREPPRPDAAPASATSSSATVPARP